MTWLENDKGVRFGDHGTVLSSAAFMTLNGEASCSLEIWLQPHFIHDSSTILTFDDSPVPFSLHQSDADLELQQGNAGVSRRSTVSKMYVGGLFQRGNPVFVTITSAETGTAVYVDGALAMMSPYFRLSSQDFTGKLVIGTATDVDDSWSGELRGLAIYDQELTAAQVVHHYGTWTQKGRPEMSEPQRCIALYIFDELRGSVVRNQCTSGVDLRIPPRYVILHERLLEAPWKEFHAGWGYWKNVLINIGGFVPLGFFFCAFWSATRPMTWAAVTTLILGAITSLAIEIAQGYLPTRNSGITDIITNTLGTYLGVLIFRRNYALIREYLTRILSVTR